MWSVRWCISSKYKINRSGGEGESEGGREGEGKRERERIGEGGEEVESC